MAAVVPNPKISPTSPSGNLLPLATRTCRRSTGVLTSRALPATETPSQRSFGAMPLKARTSRTAIPPTPATRVAGTPRTLLITACQSTRRPTAQTWTLRLRRHTPVPVRRRSTCTPPSLRNIPPRRTADLPTHTPTTCGRSGSSTPAAPGLNPPRSPPVHRSQKAGRCPFPPCEQAAATLLLTTS